jgi:beta-glucosidase/6-phospho-beta-glucosidase/beta-galactosidase
MSSTSNLENDGLELDRGFVVSTGIECSAPRIRGGLRQDELRKTGHWERYSEDFGLIADFGIRFVRYGVPFHVVAADPDQLDWQWTDRALGALREAGLEPIADLLHFGVPDDLRGVGDPRLPARYADYVRAFAERFPWVRYYTPVNEPLVTAVFSASNGWWNECARDQRALVAAIDTLSACVVSAMEIIRERRPDAIFIQSDACESYSAGHPAARRLAAHLNERRFVTYDLSYGRRPTAGIEAWLLENGMSRQRLAWFEEHGSSARCVIGHDYYRGNEHLLGADGEDVRSASPRRGYAALAREFHARYSLPFMLSETNIAGNRAPAWLAEVWNDALELRAQGLPIRGFCWYGFIDHVDWDSSLRYNRGRQNQCGLVGLDRRSHRVGQDYRRLALAAQSGIYAPIGRAPERPLRRPVLAVA